MQADSSTRKENPPGHNGKVTLWMRLVGILYYTALSVAPLVIGGVVHLTCRETPGPADSDPLNAFEAVFATAVFSGIAVFLCGFVLFRRTPRRLAFGTVWCLCLMVLLTAGLEIAVRWKTPAWPGVGLHGVSAEVAKKAWAHRDADTADSHSSEFNSWGQRDRQHAVKPPPNTYRIAFVGDSFLEESTTTPISIRVEQKLSGQTDSSPDQPQVEVINLGVSATDPDEYFYRTLNIAIALQINHCVVFVYAGNDFSAPPRTLETWGGIVAVYPRGSVFSSLGLHALNHVFTNDRRPVLQAWFASGELLAAETRLGSALAVADDKGVRDILYSLDYYTRNPTQRSTLASRLNAPETEDFFQILRKPDAGLFRSYYLSAALWSASVGGGQWNSVSENNALHWVAKTRDVCASSGVDFTLVVIPEAFQVDSRMIEQWRPLTDMQTLTATCRTTSERFAEQATNDGIRTLDLHDTFANVPGTYLNMDGHWSEKGTELAAESVAKSLHSIIGSSRP